MIQTMAQTGYQEQIPAVALFAKTEREYANCTPHRPKARFHMIWDDFITIGDNDAANGNALRAFEWLTNQRIDEWRKEHTMPGDCLPDPEDLWLDDVSTRRLAEITLRAREKSTYARCLRHPKDVNGDEDTELSDEDDNPRSLIELGFVERRFIARPGFEDMERPLVPFFEDKKGRFIIVNDEDGNYTDVYGKRHNAKEEGYIVRRQYRYCIDVVNAAIAALDWRDPPEPAKRWPPIVKRRDPVLPTQGNDAPTSTDCDPNDAQSALVEQLTSSISVQRGTEDAPIDDATPTVQSSTDSKELSITGTENGTSLSILSADSQESSAILSQAEDFQHAPWCPETLIGLARSRHTKGLFEIRDDDEDYEGAEKLDGLRQSLGLSPTQFWPILDCHIAAMMDPNSKTWWATQRYGDNLRFNLTHVDKQWKPVEDTLRKKPWSPLDTVPYFGPPEDYEEDVGAPRDHSWIFGNAGPPVECPEDIGTAIQIVEGSLEAPEVPIEKNHDVQESTASPGETEDELHQLPPPVEQWPLGKRGMSEAERDRLASLIAECYPSLILEDIGYDDGSFALRMRYGDLPRQGMTIRNQAEWYKVLNVSGAVNDAVRYGEMARCRNQ